MKTSFYQVDAFTHRLFSGNPAGVCPLESWIPPGTMLAIAAENNLAETAFFVRENDHYHIRWFTPSTEVELCGHATLAAAHVIFNHLGYTGNVIGFASLSGMLRVSRTGHSLTLDFPADPAVPVEVTPLLSECFPGHPFTAFKGKTDLMLVFDSEEVIAGLKPDMRLLMQLPQRGVIVTAKGNEVDFVSRFFGPRVGIDEDPVTGSAHTTLTPYWSGVLGKTELTAMQLSARRGWLNCSLRDVRVSITGEAVTYLTGEISY